MHSAAVPPYLSECETNADSGSDSMSEASAGPGHETGTMPLSLLQNYAIQYKTVISASVGAVVGAVVGYAALLPLCSDRC